MRTRFVDLDPYSATGCFDRWVIRRARESDDAKGSSGQGRRRAIARCLCAYCARRGRPAARALLRSCPAPGNSQPGSLPHRSTPATAYTTRPKATPGNRHTDTHDRVRHDRVGTTGTVTLRPGGTRTTSASAGPTPEPTSCSSSRSCTSASSTPPPANSSASSPSTQTGSTSPPASHPDPHPAPHAAPPRQKPRTLIVGRGHSYVLRHRTD